MERTIEPDSVPGMKELEAAQEADFAKLCEEPLLTNAASCADVRTAQKASFAKPDQFSNCCISCKQQRTIIQSCKSPSIKEIVVK